jgi:hypothetical protein
MPKVSRKVFDVLCDRRFALPQRFRCLEAHVLRRHHPGIVARKFEPAAEMMRTNTGLHADQVGWHIGKPCFHLATRPLLAQHDCATPIEADDVKRVLADIDTDHGDHTVKLLNHDVLLSFGASGQLAC